MSQSKSNKMSNMAERAFGKRSTTELIAYRNEMGLAQVEVRNFFDQEIKPLLDSGRLSEDDLRHFDDYVGNLLEETSMLIHYIDLAIDRRIKKNIDRNALTMADLPRIMKKFVDEVSVKVKDEGDGPNEKVIKPNFKE